MERILSFIFIPHGKSETLLYIVDGIGLLMSAFWITGIKEALSIYILVLTAVSLTLTLGVKVYNLLNDNDKNKKI